MRRHTTYFGTIALLGKTLVVCTTFAACASAARTPAERTARVENLSIRRLDDSDISAYVERDPTMAKQSLLLVLQGSICESVAPGASDHMNIARPARMARLDIEKYGLSPIHNGAGNTPCPADYLAHNTVDQRVLDVLTVIADLRVHASWWNGKLYLMGTSEGATVAAISGALMPQTQGIVLVNGSIGRPFREGWADAMANAVSSQGGDASSIAEARKEATDTWEKARHHPSPDEEAFGKGNTLLWWRSIIDVRPSNVLVLTSAPILLMQADHDEMTPVTSARAVEQQFKQAGKANLTYIELAGLTHGLRSIDGKPAWAPVLQQITDWLTAQDAR